MYHLHPHSLLSRTSLITHPPNRRSLPNRCSLTSACFPRGAPHLDARLKVWKRGPLCSVYAVLHACMHAPGRPCRSEQRNSPSHPQLCFFSPASAHPLPPSAEDPTTVHETSTLACVREKPGDLAIGNKGKPEKKQQQQHDCCSPLMSVISSELYSQAQPRPAQPCLLQAALFYYARKYSSNRHAANRRACTS